MANLLNFNKKSIKKIKQLLFLLFLFFIYFIVCAKSYSKAVSTDISNSLFRLHVIANSDTEEDQTLKLKIRDNILEYTNTLISPSMNKDQIISLLQKNKDTLYEIAYNTIKQYGFDYAVKLSFGNFYFPTKNYGDISLPAGNYDGLRIEIGESKRTKLVVRYVSTFMFRRCN